MEVVKNAKPNLRLDHIAVWVGDLEKTSKFLTDIVGWKRHPMEFGVSPEDETTGGMEGVFFDANGVWLELILPTSPGPGVPESAPLEAMVSHAGPLPGGSFEKTKVSPAFGSVASPMSD